MALSGFTQARCGLRRSMRTRGSGLRGTGSGPRVACSCGPRGSRRSERGVLRGSPPGMKGRLAGPSRAGHWGVEKSAARLAEPRGRRSLGRRVRRPTGSFAFGSGPREEPGGRRAAGGPRCGGDAGRGVGPSGAASAHRPHFAGGRPLPAPRVTSERQAPAWTPRAALEVSGAVRRGSQAVPGPGVDRRRPPPAGPPEPDRAGASASEPGRPRRFPSAPRPS